MEMLRPAFQKWRAVRENGVYYLAYYYGSPITMLIIVSSYTYIETFMFLEFHSHHLAATQCMFYQLCHEGF